MYSSLLSRRYLTSRLIPLIAVAAVALCVALVIIVVSVMTGFLEMVRNSGRTLMGDVIVAHPIEGIPYYDRLMERLRGLEDVHAVTPVVDGLGVMRMPYDYTEGVQFWGIEPESFREVTGYESTLYWTTIDEGHRRRLLQRAVDLRWDSLLESMTFEQRRSLATQRIVLERPDFTAEDFESLPIAEQRDWLETRSGDFWREAMITMAARSPGLRDVLTDEQWATVLAIDGRIEDPDLIFQEGLQLRRIATERSGIVLGIHVSEANVRQPDGSYLQDLQWWSPAHDVTLTTLPIDDDTSSIGDPETLVLDVVNEFVSGVYVIDDKRCFISLEDAQFMLHMEARVRVDPDDPDIEIGTVPARVTQVLVRAVDGVTPDALRESIMLEYDRFHDEILMDDTALVKVPPRGFGLTIKTWEQQQAQFIGPVEKERELMRTLFSIVYLVCAGLVLAIFWAIVYEKTRDIGILRSIGASRVGIAMIFLRYGAVIGVLGAIVGLCLAWVVTRNIQSIHDALGQEAPTWAWILAFVGAAGALGAAFWRSRTGLLLPVVLWSLLGITLAIIGGVLMVHKGTLVWDPAVYYFTEIPNEVDKVTAVTTMIGAVIFSVLGAVVPAAKAADTDPVNALRYE